MRGSILVFSLVLAGCDTPGPNQIDGRFDGPPRDAHAADAPDDGSPPADARLPDAGAPDAPASDAG